ncbi:hypothetical protein OUY22_28635 [Nonomuraea sp. MCN248]|uniref:Uncharacterized protein n=1 Tax=Nonomuraea corallina TaxID=2989783 RepID=A0ABT4SJV7_9ACTN|nr:hypothetical protein [Nonomuraea corallina]MDA0637390.1 hypothetical protein [Nonomuraea corallina]
MLSKRAMSVGLIVLVTVTALWMSTSLHSEEVIARTKLVLANGLQVARPDYRIMLWDGVGDAKKAPFSVSVPVSILDYPSTGPGVRVWLTRPLIGSAGLRPDLPASRVAEQLKTFSKIHGKVGMEAAVRDMPAEQEAAVLIKFSPPVSETEARKFADMDLSGHALYILSDDTVANGFPVTWRMGGDTCVHRLLSGCNPTSPTAQLRQWLSLLQSEDSVMLADLGLRMEGLYQAQREGLVHGLVLNVSGRERLLYLLARPRVTVLGVFPA